MYHPPSLPVVNQRDTKSVRFNNVDGVKETHRPRRDRSCEVALDLSDDGADHSNFSDDLHSM